jgi:hypothetical protein
MNRRRFGKTFAPVVFACAIFPALAGMGAAQDETVRIEGKVAWIAAEKMVVAPTGGLPVSIDLSQVDQAEYMGLMSGDRVIVTGKLSPDRDRVMATSIQRLGA